MTLPVRSSALVGGGGASTRNFNVTLPPGIQNGDLLIVYLMSSTVNGAIANHEWPAKGWWRLGGSAVNSRWWGVLARIYDSATPAEDYQFLLNSTAVTRWITHAVSGHDVLAEEDLIIGTPWIRGSNGGSQGRIVAPSVTTPADDYLVMGLTGEASTSAGGYTILTPEFSVWEDAPEWPSVSIEWLTSWYREMPTVGASGDLEIQFTAATSLNGVGFQFAIPGHDDGPVATGTIGAHFVPNFSPTSLTIAVSRKRGDVIKAVVGGVEHTIPIDPASGWGNVTIAGLTPDTLYEIGFKADGLLQTDASLSVKTAALSGSFSVVAGSCGFTGSTHPAYTRMLEESPAFIAHMGDLHYADAEEVGAWRAAMLQSLSASTQQALYRAVPMAFTWDNHDRILIGALNTGLTDPATLTEWRRFAGNDWPVSNANARTWVQGRVRFIMTDHWTVRDATTFMGAEQKQWFKDTLSAATEPVIVWFCQWTARNNGNGRWQSFAAETSELEAFIDGIPGLSDRMVLVGGDSHSLQADDGSRSGTGYRFNGIPSLNASGFNRTGTEGDGSTGWSIANEGTRPVGQPEADWGAYSLLDFTDDGSDVTMKWDAVQVGPTGDKTTLATFSKTFSPPEPSSQPWETVFIGSVEVSAVYVGASQVWP